MTEREALSTVRALKLALEALEGQCRLVSQTRHRLVGPAITAIKEALSSCQCQECKVVLHASDCAVHSEPAYPKSECNCGAQPSVSVEQEPVAWSYWQSCLNDDGTQTAPWVHRLSKFQPSESIINKDITPLYTTPPQRKPLSDEEFRAILRSLSRQQGWDGDGWDLALKEAIEAAHGIKELKEYKK